MPVSKVTSDLLCSDGQRPRALAGVTSTSSTFSKVHISRNLEKSMIRSGFATACQASPLAIIRHNFCCAYEDPNPNDCSGRLYLTQCFQSCMKVVSEWLLHQLIIELYSFTFLTRCYHHPQNSRHCQYHGWDINCRRNRKMESS